MASQNPITRALALATLLLLPVAAAPLSAAPLFDVKLVTSSGEFTLTDVAVVSGAEVVGGTLGNSLEEFLFPGDFIDASVSGLTWDILIGIEAFPEEFPASEATVDLGGGARYELSNFRFDPSASTEISALSSEFDFILDPAAFAPTFTPTMVSLPIEGMVLIGECADEEGRCGQVRLTVNFTELTEDPDPSAVPEPSSYVLLAAGLLAFAGFAGQRGRSRRA